MKYLIRNKTTGQVWSSIGWVFPYGNTIVITHNACTNKRSAISNFKNSFVNREERYPNQTDLNIEVVKVKGVNAYEIVE